MSLEDRFIPIDDLIQYPKLTLAASSLTPLEKVFLGNFLVMVQPKTVLELGTLKAVTTDFICSLLQANSIDGHVYSFDIQEVVDGLRSENARVQELESQGKMTLVPGILPDSLREWLAAHPEPVDFALIDAMHDYPSVTSELELLWPRLSDQGVILCHDYDFRKEHEGVRYAIDRFAARTKGAQVCSLMAKPEVQTLDDLDPYKYVCTLAVVRKRPYKTSVFRLARHLNQEMNWKLRRRTGKDLKGNLRNVALAPVRKIRAMMKARS